MNVDDVIKGYIALRDKKEETERRHKEELAPLRDRMAKVEAWLHDHLLQHNLTNLKGASGTAFLQEATSVTVADWDAAFEFIQQEGAWELLEHRVSNSVVQDYIESKGVTPPGVNVKKELVVRVRRG